MEKPKNFRNAVWLYVFYGVIIFVLEVKIDHRMIHKIGTDTWEVTDDNNTLVFEMVLRPYARK